MKILNNTVIFSIKMAMTRNVNLAIVGTSVSSKAAMVVSAIEATVADGSVARDASISIIDSGDDSNVVGVSGGISVMLGKAVGNLSKSVGFGIGIGVSLALAVVVATEAVAAEASVADVSSSVTTIVSAVANGSIARDASMAVVYSSDDSNVVRVAGGISVVLGKAKSNLAKSVSIGLSIRVGLSLALAIVVPTIARVADVSVVANMSDVSSPVSSVVSTVANGSIARDASMSIVYSSDDSNVVRVAGGIGVVLGKTVGNLAESVSIGLSIRVGLGCNNGQQDLDNMFVKMAIKEGKTHNGKSFHLSWTEAEPTTTGGERGVGKLFIRKLWKRVKVIVRRVKVAPRVKGGAGQLDSG